MADSVSWKRMRLRYAGNRRECGAAVARSEPAVYDKVARNVLCLKCADDVAPAGSGAGGDARAIVASSRVESKAGVGVAGCAEGMPPDTAPPLTDLIRDESVAAPIDPGTAEASARRESSGAPANGRRAFARSIRNSAD